VRPIFGDVKQGATRPYSDRNIVEGGPEKDAVAHMRFPSLSRTLF
jgi:hypothetical protein